MKKRISIQQTAADLFVECLKNEGVKYVFGVPGDKNIWGWRLEGHHVAFNFSVDKKNIHRFLK